ncbi:MAG: hypothetical protein JST55_02360 [Bacteroidetes bacterium]|nr:hypothetical protein [Bacteroidota bacterium]
MNEGKPSKEQLDYYFKTSRKYFDSLALKYMQEDKEYYNNYFAPYYNNPLVRARGTGGVKIFIYVMAIFMTSMAVLAIVVLSQKGVTLKDVFDFKDEPDETETMYETVTTTEKKISPDSKDFDKFDTLAVSYLKSDFEKGAYYYGRKNYDVAEKYLNKIEKKDKDYVPAQEVLKMIQKERNKEQPARKKVLEKID